MITVELGKTYRDKVTGFIGVAIGRSMWLTGCATIGLQPKIDKDGKKSETEWIDELRLELTDDVVPEVKGNASIGGPKDVPSQCV